MISKKDVIYMAELARIKITLKEAEKFQKDFADILAYFKVLQKAKVSQKEKINFQEVVLREDKVEKFSGNVLDSAKNKKGNYIKVKNIF